MFLICYQYSRNKSRKGAWRGRVSSYQTLYLLSSNWVKEQPRGSNQGMTMCTVLSETAPSLLGGSSQSTQSRRGGAENKPHSLPGTEQEYGAHNWAHRAATNLLQDLLLLLEPEIKSLFFLNASKYVNNNKILPLFIIGVKLNIRN